MPSTERRESVRHEKSVDSLTTLVTALRWGTTTTSLVWAAFVRAHGASVVAGLVLVAYATLRTFRPVEYRRRGWQSLLSILFELALTCAVIVGSGCWQSPFIFTLFTPVIAAGFARGFWHSFRVGVTGAFAVGAAASSLGVESGVQPIAAWCGELLLTAIVASYGRRLLTRAEEFRALNLSQLWRLNEANGLLVNLNRLAHDLPASFDFAETVDRAIAQTREVAPSDVCAVLTLDPMSPLWSVASAEGAILSDSYPESRLPDAVRSVARQTLPQLVDTLSADYPGLSQGAKCGLYVPLWAGPRQVGLLVLESYEPSKFGMRHATALQEFAESIALTIDNARWFDRLRARGAAQERNRIARDLHDRVGQEIAYVAFELDRLNERAQSSELADDITRLRNDTREIVKELRETLYDLRTDVNEQNELIRVIGSFLDRVSNRSGIHVTFDTDGERRLPLTQEREIWRVAQEAIVNAERHADATSIRVRWIADNDGAELVIADDGVGITHNEHTSNHNNDHLADRRPSYGIVGMRERAESIGGLLELYPNEGTGTIVRLRLGAKREENLSKDTEGISEHV